MDPGPLVDAKPRRFADWHDAQSNGCVDVVVFWRRVVDLVQHLQLLFRRREQHDWQESYGGGW